MDTQIKDKIQKYEELKLAEKDIKEQAEELKKEITPYIIENYLDAELQLSKGKIVVKHRANWEFSPNTQQRQKEVKEMEKEEIAKGIAKDKGTDYIEYRVDKGQE